MSIIRTLKASAKQMLVKRQHEKYAEKLKNSKISYDSWIRDKESQLQLENAGNPSIGILTFAECGLGLDEKIALMQENIIVFHANSGKLSKLAKKMVVEFMITHPTIPLVYGDEDCMEADGTRTEPWFKPDWSPDTFLNRFYFGSVFAMKRENALVTLQRMQENGEISASPEQNLYRLCYLLAQENGGFEKRTPTEAEKMEESAGWPIGHISEILFHRKTLPVIWKGDLGEENADYDGQLISVIIPSKDHPDILQRCISSFVKLSKARNYQFIVVDNGSTKENQQAAEAFIEKLNQEEKREHPHLYLYRQMPFNFSKMCNIGARAAVEAALLLFLNDDMEIRQPDFLEKMAGKAMVPRVGAVGAKLLYPDSDIIQHAGISNLRVGPVHKLQFLSDSQEHYFGQNHGVHDMAAVTGACLMVRKDVFEEAGGFAEELAVAFNDVDLCYTIFEAGYYNVVLNDVILYHHESLSRGRDGETEEKRSRLERENDMLYRRHLGIYARDPFYHKYLMSDMIVPEFVPAIHYQVDLERMPWASVTVDDGTAAGCPVDACLRVGVEFTADLFKWKHGITIEEAMPGEKNRVSDEDEGYYFQGYSFVIGGDNACYERTLLIKDQQNGLLWQIPIETRYRPDIKEELKDQLNVDLTGFAAKIKKAAILPGNYLFGMMVKDRCSRQRLVNWSERELKIKK